MIDKYWAIASAHWWLVLVTLLVIGFVFVIVWFQWSKRNDYDFLDSLKDPLTGKASPDPLIVYAMAGLAGWYVVVKTLNPAAGSAGSELVNILLIFLVYRGAKQGIEAWKIKPPAPPALPQPTGDNVGVKQILNNDAAEQATASTTQAIRSGGGAIKLPEKES